MINFEPEKIELDAYCIYECAPEQILPAYWPELLGEWEQHFKKLISSRHFGVLPATGFDFFFLSVLAWELSEGTQRFGNLVFDSQMVEKAIGRCPDFTGKWEIVYETEQGRFPNDTNFRSKKFENRESHLFSLDSIDDLCSVFGGGHFSDATAELNVFGIKHGTMTELSNFLKKKRPYPTNDSLMQVCDHFIDIVPGFDLGYSNGFLYYTKTRDETSVYEIIKYIKDRALLLGEEMKNDRGIPEIVTVLEFFADG